MLAKTKVDDLYARASVRDDEKKELSRESDIIFYTIDSKKIRYGFGET